MAANCWLDIDAESPFSIGNISFGIASKPADAAAPTSAIAVGDHVIFLQDLASGGALARFPAILWPVGRCASIIIPMVSLPSWLLSRASASKHAAAFFSPMTCT
ncbi:hypothetical protein LTR36_003006 [Oleoguttula mirabilis]|uniref:Uncharacterized protein n=1 Tax=Oleoguttula mirabilis TaxID=1507867 RepID=A0AAV9JXF3_9PEZI|nr:hypothetical protein LTR36_003006 [Oleoguttula mirabilis]